MMNQDERDLAIQTSKMAALGEIAAAISHELNNPLTEITGNIWLLKRHYERGMSPGEFDSYISNLERTTARMSAIVKSMLAFARNSSHDDFRETKISSIVEETLLFCSKRYESGGVSLDVILADPELALFCNPTQISQVLLNLLNNAYDAVSSQSNKWVTLVINEADDKIVMKVTDCGEGLRKEVVGKLMLPFFTTKESGKGTGLGLSICRSIVESHRGNIYYDKDHPNTRFVVVLPKVQVATKKNVP